jgi:hypothetical protein
MPLLVLATVVLVVKYLFLLELLLFLLVVMRIFSAVTAHPHLVARWLF